jgi:tyrosinase
MYLHHFEMIVAAEIIRQNGSEDWGLPYWNYSTSSSSSLLPPAFRDPKLPNGTDNPLYVAEREPTCNAGNEFADVRDTDLGACLRAPSFESSAFGGDVGFGGPATRFEHGGGNQGLLERVPHGETCVGRPEARQSGR